MTNMKETMTKMNRSNFPLFLNNALQKWRMCPYYVDWSPQKGSGQLFPICAFQVFSNQWHQGTCIKFYQDCLQEKLRECRLTVLGENARNLKFQRNSSFPVKGKTLLSPVYPESQYRTCSLLLYEF